MHMSRTRRTTLALALAFALFFVLLAVLSQPAGESAAASAEVGCAYILSQFNGYVAVYEYGSQTPYFITDTRLDSLPRLDREMLSEGIKVYSDEELAALLEDYGT